MLPARYETERQRSVCATAASATTTTASTTACERDLPAVRWHALLSDFAFQQWQMCRNAAAAWRRLLPLDWIVAVWRCLPGDLALQSRRRSRAVDLLSSRANAKLRDQPAVVLPVRPGAAAAERIVRTAATATTTTASGARFDLPVRHRLLSAFGYQLRPKSDVWRPLLPAGIGGAWGAWSRRWWLRPVGSDKELQPRPLRSLLPRWPVP